MMETMKNFLNRIIDFGKTNPAWFCFWFVIGWILGLGIKDLL